MAKRTLRERFESKIARSEGGCWEWTAARFQSGYGAIRIEGQTRLAHRISHELYIGPIPEGLGIDHLCKNRGCVRPSHIEAVPQRVNLARGDHPAAIVRRTNVCGHGHALTPENTYITPAGWRRCRECCRRHGRELRQRRRAARGG